MKQFFKTVYTMVKDFFYGNADKHQKYLTYGTLIFGLLVSIIFGVVSSILLMLIASFVVEFTYCFVPTKVIIYKEKEFKVPNYKEFFTNIPKYITNPKHEFKIGNIVYIIVSIVLFLVIKAIFLIF